MVGLSTGIAILGSKSHSLIYSILVCYNISQFALTLYIDFLRNIVSDYVWPHFSCSGYVFAVSVHRVQLLLQVLNVKRFHHQQQQQQHPQSSTQEELTPSEIHEICDYFSRCVVCEPYDASRIASFIMLLTLPIPAIQEFLKLIAWNKSLSQAHGDIVTAQRARAELCLEKHLRSFSGDYTETSSSTKSNIQHDRANNSVAFTITFMLDHSLTPHMSTSGGASWLPYCVSLKIGRASCRERVFAVV